MLRPAQYFTKPPTLTMSSMTGKHLVRNFQSNSEAVYMIYTNDKYQTTQLFGTGGRKQFMAHSLPESSPGYSMLKAREPPLKMQVGDIPS